MIIKGKAEQKKKDWSLLILAGLLLVVLFFDQQRSAKDPSEELSKKKYIIYCSMEHTDGDDFVEQGMRFGGGATQTSELAKKGSHASVIEKDSIGFFYQFTTAEQGKTYKASIWKRGNTPQKAFLAVANASGNFFKQTNKSIESDGNFWARQELIFTIPNEHPGDLKIFAYKESSGEKVFFDEFLLQEIDEVVTTERKAFGADSLVVQIARADIKKLEKIKMRSQKDGLYIRQKEDMVQARIWDAGRYKKAKMRFKGDWLDHLSWKGASYRIEMNKAEAWKGMQVFSVQRPEVRGYLREWVYHQMLLKEDVLSPRYDLIYFRLNDNKPKVYVYEEHFNKNLLEHQLRREGPILKMDESRFWDGLKRHMDIYGELPGAENKNAAMRSSEIKAFKPGRVAKSSVLSKEFEQAQNLVYQYKNNLKPAGEIFDMDRMAKFVAVTELCMATHALTWHNQRFYYNPVTNLLEPIGFDGFGGEDLSMDLYTDAVFEPHPAIEEPLHKLFEDPEFLRAYFSHLMRIAQREHIELFLSQIEEDLQVRERFIRQDQADYHYDRDELRNKAKKIQFELPVFNNSLQSHTRPIPGEDSLELRLTNVHKVPIEVYIPKTKYRTIVMPDRWADSIYSPILKIHKSVQDIYFGLPGLELDKQITIGRFGYPQNRTARQQIKGRDIGDVLRSDDGVHHYFKNKEVLIDRPIYIQKHNYLVVDPGTIIRFEGRGYIVSESAVYFDGSAESPIVFESTDGKSGAIAVLQADSTSVIRHTIFDGLNTLDDGGWFLTGAVSFYESDVHISDSKFLSNQCEDALNIIRSDFEVSSSVFRDIRSDAFDADYSRGTVSDCLFELTGNDALDFSTSQIQVKNCTMRQIGDKAISVGEQATVMAEGIVIERAHLGVASKDKSVMEIKDIRMEECKTGFAAYQKKPEFGPATIICAAFDYEDIDHLFMIESGSVFVYQ